MKIVIDGRMLGWTGIGRYTKELIENLSQIDAQNQYVILLQTKDQGKLAKLAPNFRILLVDIEPYSLGEQLELPSIVRGLKADLVHFTHFSIPYLYRGLKVTNVHDLSLVRFKTNRGNGLRRLKFEAKYLAMRVILRRAVTSSVKIITLSQWVKQDLINYYHQPELASKLVPIYLGVPQLEAEPGSITKFNLETGQFLLYVGGSYPNKNVGRLVEAFAQLAPQHPALKLVLVGPDDYFAGLIKQRVAALGLGDRVVMPGFVDDQELAGLYQAAALFVFPSLSEGFGLPPLEAMAQGTPVISSKATSMPEVLGEAAAYFDPTSPADMAAKIASLLDNPVELERLRHAGAEQVKKYSWRTMAEQTLGVYKEVLPSSAPTSIK